MRRVWLGADHQRVESDARRVLRPKLSISEEELRPQLVGDLVDLNGHVLAALDSPVDKARDREGHVLAG